MATPYTDCVLQLDLQLSYLRRVHALCFYSAEEYDDERVLASKCGPVYLRSRLRLPESQLSFSNHALTLNFEDRITKYAKDRIAKGPNRLLKACCDADA